MNNNNNNKVYQNGVKVTKITTPLIQQNGGGTIGGVGGVCGIGTTNNGNAVIDTNNEIENNSDYINNKTIILKNGINGYLKQHHFENEANLNLKNQYYNKLNGYAKLNQQMTNINNNNIDKIPISVVPLNNHNNTNNINNNYTTGAISPPPMLNGTNGTNGITNGLTLDLSQGLFVFFSLCFIC